MKKILLAVAVFVATVSLSYADSVKLDFSSPAGGGHGGNITGLGTNTVTATGIPIGFFSVNGTSSSDDTYTVTSGLLSVTALTDVHGDKSGTFRITGIITTGIDDPSNVLNVTGDSIHPLLQGTLSDFSTTSGSIGFMVGAASMNGNLLSDLGLSPTQRFLLGDGFISENGHDKRGRLLTSTDLPLKTPEPASLALLAPGLLFVGGFLRRKIKG